jgi:hypothetical protein
MGKAWLLKKDKNNQPYKCLPFDLTLNDVQWNPPPKRKNDDTLSKNKKSKLFTSIIENNDNKIINLKSKFLLPCKIQVNSNNNSKTELLSKVLIDTGALDGNYINIQVSKELEKLGFKINKNKNYFICHVFGDCFHVLGDIIII